MSNLGMYQKITTWSKKVNGPINLLFLTAIGGYVVIRIGEESLKWGSKKIRAYINKKKKNITEPIGEPYNITEDYVDKFGLNVQKGDIIYVIDINDDVVLLEKVNDDNNPYVISLQVLRNISDYGERR